MTTTSMPSLMDSNSNSNSNSNTSFADDARQWAAFMDDRAWTSVCAFAKKCARGKAMLGECRGTRDARAGGRAREFERERTDARACENSSDATSIRIRARVWYYGPSHAAFAWSREDVARLASGDDALASVESTIRRDFASVIALSSAIAIAGRTDRGAHALANVCSFRVREGMGVEDVERVARASAEARRGAARLTEISRVPHSFHATFSATYRRYVYIVPRAQLRREAHAPRMEIDVAKANRMLASLTTASANDGIDVYAFARATPKGKSCVVRFVVASAFASTLPASREDDGDDDDDDGDDDGAVVDANRRSRASAARERTMRASAVDSPNASDESASLDVIVFELIADRFLRKLVRCLVSTTCREAARSADDDVLVRMAHSRDRRLPAPPAPPVGLFFAGVSYSDDFECSREA